MTTNLELYTTIQQALKAGHIPYDVKVVNTCTQSRRTGTLLGRIGERPGLEIQYYIYTPCEYAERAKFAINDYRRNQH
ncbi:hypothetical protein ADH76_11040 [Enterocloster clostridioformis]|uniref:hypothetical protein n=1 Tax=Enterocloster clostridioformis TaxID=1531 RepID=UPI00080C6028|nr:hypothetical protein [Enterocloster clostridioformis]ANU48343.1 hypothetical protein A4V08_23560 [Lachnoclostridium sp. YL32]NDO29407.1 hypothetical protein [Enterocloster clostridioformis]OXE68950.1 hypothetical protein ADH76_11040 [Enterocloster clostridioformis]QQR02766.1 hypothetical protein I5Q83_11240 [Enterocloster clostridioformis]